jgi:hypothetical protein
MHGRTLLLVVWSERAHGQLQRRFLLPVGFKLCIGHRPLSRGFVLPHTRGMCSVRGGNSVGGGRHYVLSVPGQYVCICQRADCVHCVWNWDLFWKRVDILLESYQCVRHRSLMFFFWICLFTCTEHKLSDSLPLIPWCIFRFVSCPSLIQHDLRSRTAPERLIV